MTDKSSGIMNGPMRFVDISFHCNQQFDDPAVFFSAFKEGFGYIQHIKKQMVVHIVEHSHFEANYMFQGIPSVFFKGRNKFFHIPLKAIRHVKKLKPDVVLCQGLKFPVQLIALCMFMPGKTRILVQHHGEQPFTGLRRLFQKWADRFVDGYLFTAAGNARPWTDAGIIAQQDKCFELLEASTFFTRKDKTQSKKLTGMEGDTNFLWVGRLTGSKDPKTVLNGFGKYVETNKSAHLYMIYQDNELEAEVRAIINSSENLKKSVTLIGKVSHSDLQNWYSAADFYLSGSHREGSGYALIECMACGCIPVVTDIPSFRMITGNGKYGLLFEPGNPDDLAGKLLSLSDIDRLKLSEEISLYFEKNLTFKAIADNLTGIIQSIMP